MHVHMYVCMYVCVCRKKKLYKPTALTLPIVIPDETFKEYLISTFVTPLIRVGGIAFMYVYTHF